MPTMWCLPSQRIFDRNNPWHNVNGSNFPYFDSLQFADNVKSVRTG